MGLDSVELLVEVEQAFGIEISDQEAGNIATVGDFVNAVFSKVRLVPGEKCLTQIVFYRIREAFMLLRGEEVEVRPASKIIDLLDDNSVKVGWEFLESQVQLKFPKLVRMDIDRELNRDVRLLGIRIFTRIEALTKSSVEKLIGWIISLNFNELIDLEKISSKYEVERIIVGIISDKMGIPVNEIEQHHSITSDLGIN
ncbi:hypothetical protein [Tunicatimonas pelagia]|uniref:hypothetical protein n=1 Tax=Tunicatimonas pelagia TaxID=931531 RepID=UPI0026661ADB|nr:hypothetical protein [Tunicatimonas pelagia]WKN41660.1 hypothetical protein P0M28_21725 [Tunicatimonas pelagia]